MNEETLNEEALFTAAIEIASRHERAQYLDEACAGDAELRGRVEALLAAYDHPDSFLEPPAPGEPTSTDGPSVSEGPGSVIDRYKLLEQIGEGGFGVVYMAEQQEPVRRNYGWIISRPQKSP